MTQTPATPQTAPLTDPVSSALTAAKADPAKVGAFELALISALLYVVPADGPPPLDKTFGVDVPFTLMGVTLKDGTRANGLFTTREAAAAVFGDAPLMGIRGLHALQILREHWIALNPGATPGLILSPDQIQAILESVGEVRLTSVDAPGRTPTMPEREPLELTDRLRRALTHETISGVWLGRITDPETGAPGWLLQVQGTAPFANVRAAVDIAAVGLDFHGETLDLSVGLPGGPEGVGLRVV